MYLLHLHSIFRKEKRKAVSTSAQEKPAISGAFTYKYAYLLGKWALFKGNLLLNRGIWAPRVGILLLD